MLGLGIAGSSAPVRTRSALVARRYDQSDLELPRLAVRGLGDPRRAVPVDLRRAPHRHGSRAPARRALVASGRRRVRRDRCGLHVRGAVPRLPDDEPLRDETLLAAATRVRAKLGVSETFRSRVEEVSADTNQANAYASGSVRHARSSSGTRCSSAVLRGRAEGRPRTRARAPLAATTSRRGSAGSRSSRFRARGSSCGRHGVAAGWARRRPFRSRSSSSPSLQLATAPLSNHISPPDGDRGRLEGAAGDAGSRGARGSDDRFLRAGARRSRPTDVGQLMPARTRRSPIASRWRVRGRPAGSTPRV